jgi:protein SCO1/2
VFALVVVLAVVVFVARFLGRARALADNRDRVRTAVASLLICGAAGAGRVRNGRLSRVTTEQARRLGSHGRRVPSAGGARGSGRTPFALADYRGAPWRELRVHAVHVRVRVVELRLPADTPDGARPRGRSAAEHFVRSARHPARLREYASHFGADRRGWRFARVRDTTAIAPLLRTFGVVVISDGNGDFQHNAAVHVIDGQAGCRILDADASPDLVARAIRR